MLLLHDCCFCLHRLNVVKDIFRKYTIQIRLNMKYWSFEKIIILTKTDGRIYDISEHHEISILCWHSSVKQIFTRNQFHGRGRSDCVNLCQTEQTMSDWMIHVDRRVIIKPKFVLKNDLRFPIQARSETHTNQDINTSQEFNLSIKNKKLTWNCKKYDYNQDNKMKKGLFLIYKPQEKWNKSQSMENYFKSIIIQTIEFISFQFGTVKNSKFWWQDLHSNQKKVHWKGAKNMQNNF